MKRVFFLGLCGIFVCALAMAGGGKEKVAAPKTAPQTKAAPSQPATAQPKPANPYFDGDGGKGITLAVL